MFVFEMLHFRAVYIFFISFVGRKPKKKVVWNELDETSAGAGGV